MGGTVRLVTSDDTIFSTPNDSDHPIFSDAPQRSSSPPSSPPSFPWELQTEPKESSSVPRRPSRNAFSVLGKRKALQHVSDNPRPPKKQPSKPVVAELKPLSQMQISLGQEIQKKCKTCGMEYIASSTEDRALHNKYHKQNAEGYDVGKDFLKKAREGSLYKVARTDDTIAVIEHVDTIWRRKRARAALDIAQRELGAVDIPDEQLWQGSSKHSTSTLGSGRFAMYMYIRGTKCVGVLLAERIESARRVVKPEQPIAPTKESTQARPTSALSALRARRTAAEGDAPPDQPIKLAQRDSPASLGISRIWTSPSHRKHGIALALLDTAVSHHNQNLKSLKNSSPDAETAALSRVPDPGVGSVRAVLPEKPKRTGERVDKDGVAFSQPTVAGARLARKWIGKAYGWLVYID